MDEKFCDELMDALESAYSSLGTNVYAQIKTLMRTIQGMGQYFGRGVFNRKGLKQALLKKPNLSETEKAQLVAFIRMLPMLTRFGTEGMGQPDTGGKIPELSHEQREGIRADVKKRMEDETISEAVRRLAERHGISERECWNILREDTTNPGYWEKEILRNLRESKTPIPE